MPTAVVKTIGSAGGRDYSTISAWIAGLSTFAPTGSLVTADITYEGQCYNDGQFYETNCTLAGHTTDATHTITLTAASGESFQDNAGAQTNALRSDRTNGVEVINSGGYTSWYIFNWSDTNVTISRLQIRSVGPTRGVNLGSNGVSCRNCIIEAPTFPAVNGNYYNCSLVVYTNFPALAGSSPSTVVNCTLVKSTDSVSSTTALTTGYGAAYVMKNCAVFGFASIVGGASVTAANCMTDCASAPTGFATSKTYASQFVDTGTTLANRDYRAKTGADLLDAGATYTTDIPAADDIVKTARPQGAAWDIGCWELAPTGPPPTYPTLTSTLASIAQPDALTTGRGIVANPATAQTFYVLATNAVTPNFFGNMQQGGSAPTAANSAFGWVPSTANLSSPYYRGRLGAVGTTATGQSASYNASTSGPTAGTGTAATTAGDSFVAGPLTGTFSSGVWNYTLNLRASIAGAVGHVNVRTWRSVNANGASATQIIANTAGAIVTLSTTADVNSGITYNPGALTFNNEYLFFQTEWQETTKGTTTNNNVLFRAGTTSITTAPFAAAVGIGPSAGALASIERPDTQVATGTVADPLPLLTATLAVTELPDALAGFGTVGTALPTITGTLAVTQADQGLVATGRVGSYLVSSFTITSSQNDFDGLVGCMFQLTANQTFDNVGLLWRSWNFGTINFAYGTWGGGSLTILNETAVDMSSGVNGRFNYKPVAPFTLTAGVQYFIARRVVNGDGNSSNHGPVTLNNATGVNGVYSVGTSLAGTIFAADTMFGAEDLALFGAAPTTITGTLNVTQASQTISAQGRVLVTGTLAVAQQAQTISAQAAVRVDAILSQAQAAQALAGQGRVAIAATLSQAQAPQTISAIGQISLAAALATTQQPQTISAQAAVRITATLAQTQQPQTLAATGLVPAFGTLVQTQQPQTLLGAGSVVSPGAATGTLAVTQAPQTLLATGQTTIAGALTSTGAAQTLAGLGGVSVSAGLVTTQAGHASAAQGRVSIGATLAQTQADQTIIASAAVRISATLAQAQQPQTLLARGTVPGVATLRVTQDPQTLSGFAIVATGIAASLTVTQAPQTLNAQGAVRIGAILNVSQSNQAFLGSGGSIVTGAAAQTQQPQTISAQGRVRLSALLAVVQDSQIVLARGDVRIDGGLAATQAGQSLVSRAHVGSSYAARVMVMA
jgi:hypothetical protein